MIRTATTSGKNGGQILDVSFCIPFAPYSSMLSYNRQQAFHFHDSQVWKVFIDVTDTQTFQKPRVFQQFTLINWLVYLCALLFFKPEAANVGNFLPSLFLLWKTHCICKPWGSYTRNHSDSSTLSSLYSLFPFLQTNPKSSPRWKRNLSSLWWNLRSGLLFPHKLQ